MRSGSQDLLLSDQSQIDDTESRVLVSVGQQAGSNWAVIKCVGSAALPSTSIIIWPLVITTLFPNWAQMDSQPPTLAPMFFTLLKSAST